MGLTVAKGTLATWMQKQLEKVLVHTFLPPRACASVTRMSLSQPGGAMRDTRGKALSSHLMPMGTYRTTGQLLTDASVNHEIHQDPGTQQESLLVAVFSH